MACVQKYGVANVTKTGVANVSKRGVANVQMAYELPPFLDICIVCFITFMGYDSHAI